MIDFQKFNNYYFIGIGGIGMSALARFFNLQGKQVSGYDKSSSTITEALNNEGINISFEDRGERIVHLFSRNDTLVIYTPAIPAEMGELMAFKKFGFIIQKRAEVLGEISRKYKCIAVAGTHGKTTTSTLLAHVFANSELGCNAFLGGVSANINSNLIVNNQSNYCILEADEYDRSFLRLKPYAAVITSIDSDHLDIYHDAKEFNEAFHDFAKLIESNGYLLLNDQCNLTVKTKVIQYGQKNESDISCENIRIKPSGSYFDVNVFNKQYKDFRLNMPGVHNVENALAVIGICINEGIPIEKIRSSFDNFKGVNRRFDIHINDSKLIYIDDYAHHPTAIRSLISSVRMMFQGKKIIAIFQPHLYSRTNDFMTEFAHELGKVDELILLPIYPAREEPIPGVSSDSLLSLIKIADKKSINKDDLLNYISKLEEGVVLSIGAGDIDRLVSKIKSIINENLGK